MRQLLALLLLVPLGLIILAVVGVLAPILRWTFRFALAALVTVAAALFGVEGAALFAVFAGTLLVLSLGGSRRRRRTPAPAGAQVIDNAPPPPGPGPGPEWRELRGLADWRSRRRLDAAWDACTRYLQLAAAHEDPAAQLPIKIERHVPAIVADCVRHSRTAAPDERRALLADTLATLETLADRAETRRRELAHHAQGEFRARRAHLSNPDD